MVLDLPRLRFRTRLGRALGSLTFCRLLSAKSGSRSSVPTSPRSSPRKPLPVGMAADDLDAYLHRAVAASDLWASTRASIAPTRRSRTAAGAAWKRSECCERVRQRGLRWLSDARAAVANRCLEFDARAEADRADRDPAATSSSLHAALARAHDVQDPHSATNANSLSSGSSRGAEPRFPTSKVAHDAGVAARLRHPTAFIPACIRPRNQPASMARHGRAKARSLRSGGRHGFGRAARSDAERPRGLVVGCGARIVPRCLPATPCERAAAAVTHAAPRSRLG